MSNALSLPSRDHGTARIPSIRSASHISDSRILLTFAARVLIADPCSVTTTAYAEEFSMPTNTPGWNRGSHFLAGLERCTQYSSPIPRSACCPFVHAVCVSASFRHCRCHTCSPDPAQYILSSSGTLTPTRCANAAFKRVPPCFR